MEISSTSGMQQGLRMDGMRPPPPSGDSAEQAEEASSQFIDELDTNGDGVLSLEELSLDSDEFADIDEDGDGLVSQEELKSALEAQMEEMKAKFESEGASGMTPPEVSGLMQKMHDMAGENMDTRAKASQAYELMQENLSGSSSDTSSYNLDEVLLEQLNIAV